MADLLIRGMEMPKSCAECFADDNGWCNILGCSIGDSAALRMIDRRDDCPLVELPDHGPLCDLNALDKAFTALRFNEDGSLKHWDDRKNWCLHGSEIEKLLAEAETIIPASKEGGA